MKRVCRYFYDGCMTRLVARVVESCEQRCSFKDSMMDGKRNERSDSRICRKCIRIVCRVLIAFLKLLKVGSFCTDREWEWKIFGNVLFDNM